MKSHGYYSVTIVFPNNNEMVIGFHEDGTLVLRAVGMKPVVHKVSDNLPDRFTLEEDKSYANHGKIGWVEKVKSFF